MKYAVIYARYSSDRQNEMSIEGQIEKCRSYAEEHDIVIVQEYIDRAQTATTDKRPEFLRMISDSENGSFDTILVYQLDRFARNKDDSGYYKKILRENGVKVVSAMEQIASDSSGVITEGMLEIVADWYSKQLSEKVTRGMYQRAELRKYNGGTMTYGYQADENGYYVLDPVRASVVKELFERVAEGETIRAVTDDFNRRGITTLKGKKFSKNSMQHVLRNEKYKGVYTYGDVRIPDGIPRIVSDELFDSVQAVIGKYGKGHRPAKEDYLLTGKLYCGHCKDVMTGTSGTSRLGVTNRYYTCKNSPKKCSKKNVRKDFIEPLVLSECRNLISDKIIEEVIGRIIEVNKETQEGTDIKRLRNDVKSTEAKIEKLLNQLEEGGSKTIGDRVRKREEELEVLKRQLKIEESKQRLMDPDIVRMFLRGLRNGEFDSLEYQRMLIRVLVDRIYLYDDRFVVLLNVSKNSSKSTDKRAKEIERHLTELGSKKDYIGAPAKWDTFGYPILLFYHR